jgi:dTMP kinase
MGVDFQKRLRQGFLDIARAEPKRCVVINAARAVDDIHAEIIGIVSARLSLSVQKVANG